MAYKQNRPIIVSEGGSGATTFTAHGVLLGEGTSAFGVTAVGTTGQVLTGVTGLDPVWAAPAASSISITGDSGGALTGAAFTIYANKASLNSGSSVSFSGSGATLTLNVSDTSHNTIIGKNAGTTVNTAADNTSIGDGCFALLNNGSRNVAVGRNAGGLIQNGTNNIALGYGALSAARDSSSDIAIGDGSLGSLITSGTNGNVVIGANNSFGSLATGTKNIGIGYNIGTAYTTSESSNILLNSAGVVAESNVLRIGAGTGSTAQKLAKAYICGIDGVNVGSVAKVLTMASDQLGTATITAGTGISVTPGANTITIANTASSSISITGDSGGALSGSAFTFTGGTTGLTFSGSGSTVTLTGTLVVANGGSGRATATAYAVICGGTTSTGAHQSIAAVGSTGQVLTSNGAGALPTFQAAAAGGLTWSVITANQTAVVANGYICNKATTLVLTLPASGAIGDIIEVTGINVATGWQIAQSANQQIFFGNTQTTLGATGTLTSSAIRDSIKIVCVVSGSSTVWNVLSSVGNITVV